MKRIIGLCGKGNIGKTETLNLLIDLLTVATTGCAMPSPQPAGRNREMTFIYKGNTISICTAGDTEAILKDNCAYFSKMKCDIWNTYAVFYDDIKINSCFFFANFNFYTFYKINNNYNTKN